jgi:hypothetical protein
MQIGNIFGKNILGCLLEINLGMGVFWERFWSFWEGVERVWRGENEFWDGRWRFRFGCENLRVVGWVRW